MELDFFFSLFSEIKSPKMKKRIQANLRGVEEPGNEIKAPTPDLLSNLDESSSSAPSHKSPGLTFKLPPPPPKTIQALENSVFASPVPPPPSLPHPHHRITSPLDTRPSSALSNTYDSSFDEQLSNLCSGLNLKTDCNNNNLGKLYSFNNVSLSIFQSILYIYFTCFSICSFSSWPHHSSSLSTVQQLSQAFYPQLSSFFFLSLRINKQTSSDICEDAASIVHRRSNRHRMLPSTSSAPNTTCTWSCLAECIGTWGRLRTVAESTCCQPAVRVRAQPARTVARSKAAAAERPIDSAGKVRPLEPIWKKLSLPLTNCVVQSHLPLLPFNHQRF